MYQLIASRKQAKSVLRFCVLGGSLLTLSACSIAPQMTSAETQIRDDLHVSNYTPAERTVRDNIETQDLFAQAAFWSREYELNPADLESAIRLSSAIRKMGNPTQAIEIAQTSRAIHPRDPYLAAELVAAQIAAERAEDALETVDKILPIAPGYARLWSLKGAALDQLERYDLARQHYARALSITPNDPNVMSNVGLSYALQGDVQTAEGWLRRASALPGASEGVRQNLDLVLGLQGKDPISGNYGGASAAIPPMAPGMGRGFPQQPRFDRGARQRFSTPQAQAPRPNMQQQATAPRVEMQTTPMRQRTAPTQPTPPQSQSQGQSYSPAQTPFSRMTVTTDQAVGPNGKPLSSADMIRQAARQKRAPQTAPYAPPANGQDVLNRIAAQNQRGKPAQAQAQAQAQANTNTNTNTAYYPGRTNPTQPPAAAPPTNPYGAYPSLAGAPQAQQQDRRRAPARRRR